ncbi:hypothetical protein [Woodsholea maritima]|uniref:hypothetical protein n=1 Tax=Woodsholea maritima TaxID=240237 RepID=UPI000375BCB8|nr:hypothetical protein [Woodsholea maritima]
MKMIWAGALGALSICGSVWAQEGREYSPLGEVLKLNTPVTTILTDTQEHITQDAVYLLKARQSGVVAANTFTLGGFVKAGQYYESTDQAGKYPILGRFPFQHGKGTSNQDFVINVAGLSGIASVGDWLTAYAQVEYSEVTFTGDHDQIQWREYYAVLGNLDVFGGYLAYGRKSIDFGEQFGYNPFTHSVNQHFFWALADEPVLEVGYIGETWRVSGTLAPGERMLRVGMTTDREGDLGSNFALKAERHFNLGADRQLRVSASYLHDTIYNNNYTAHTLHAINRQAPPHAPLPPRVYIAKRTGLMDVAAEFTSPRFDLAVEYTQSTRSWIATSFDTHTGAKFDGTRPLSALSVMGRYKTRVFNVPTDLAAVYSQSVMGPDNTEFNDVFQHTLSTEFHLNPYLDLGIELVLNEGFQPFVGIQDVSISNVQSQVGIVGVTARF